MSSAKRARTGAGVCLLFALSGPMALYGQGSPSDSTGATTPAQSRVVEGALEQLSAPAGQSPSAPTDDSFRGSVVTGQPTGGVLDLSLDEAISRGLRHNLGLLL